jgi:site-specific DNA recombinase
VIIDAYQNQNNGQQDNRSELLKEINVLNDKLSKGRELLLNGDLEPSDYKEIKLESERRIMVIEAHLSELARNKKRIINIEPIVYGAIANLTKLSAIYCQSEPCEKRELIGSMYPKKFTFEELQHRTAQIDDFYSYIYLINRQLERKKRGASDRNSCLPTLAPEAGLEPATL